MEQDSKRTLNDPGKRACIDWIARSQNVRLRVENLIDGLRASPGGPPVEKYSPRDGQLMCRFGQGTSQEVGQAVDAARRAFSDGRWSKLPLKRRKDVLHAFASLLISHQEELALIECMDVGKPITDAMNFDVPVSAARIQFFAEAPDKLYSKVFGANPHSLSYQLSRPIGVVAAIIGWNFPLILAASKIGPALAAGNCLILKPSEISPFSALRVAELALEAGVPNGVLNVLHGGPHIGAALSGHNDVDLVTFTGSSQTGKKLLIAAGQSNMKRLILECGGKAANIVFDDGPDLDRVADAIVSRAYWNQGQVCTASSRILIQEGIKDELLSRIVKRAALLTPADPLSPDSTFGALISERHKQKVLSYISTGHREGAKVVHEPPEKSPFASGFYVPPVIFDEVFAHHQIAQEEIFGPVMSVMSFRCEEEAIRIANDTIYGLSAVLWTRDLGRAHRVSQELDVGWTVINATDNPKGGEAAISVGGHKQSGIGTEGGMEGLQEYMTKTAVQLFV